MMKRTAIAWRALACGTALLASATGSRAFAQAVPKARFIAEGSFQLPAKGQAGASERPAALAVGPGGLLHVADERGSIFVFDSTGAFRGSYGPPQLRDPRALALTPEGEAYVLDADQKQVLVYAADGQGLRAIAGRGSQGGRLADPVDLALGPNGYVYVLDRGRGGVQIFSRDGTFVRDVRFGAAIADPQSLAVGQNGAIWVTDRRRPNEVVIFPPFTELPWLSTLPPGTPSRAVFRGTGPLAPGATVVNGVGTAIVLDRESGRLWRVNPKAPQELGADDAVYGGSGSGRGSFQEAVDLALAGNGDLLILDGRLRKVERVRLTTEEGLPRIPELSYPVRVTRSARELGVPLLDVGYTSAGAPLLLMQTERRVVSLHVAEAVAFETAYGDSVRALLPDPRRPQREFFQQIGDVGEAIFADTVVVVVDPRRDRFAVFNSASGALLGTYGDNYRDQRRLKDPRGGALLPDGRVVIADTGNDRVKIFSADLASLVANFPIRRPVGVAFDPNGGIFIWNEDGSVAGRLILDEARVEPLPPELFAGRVAAMTFDQAGNLFVVDAASQRITIIEAGLGRTLAQLGEEGGLDRPTRIRVDREGNIYVTEDGARRTAVFRWDVHFPPLSGLEVRLEEDAAFMSWKPGPARYVRAYQILGAATPEGPYTVLATTPQSPYLLSADVAGVPPRYVRVAPVFITGGRGRATRAVPLATFTALAAYRAGDYRSVLAEATMGVNAIADGAVDADDGARGKILRLGFASAYRLGELRTAVTWARRAVEIPMPRADLVEFLFMLADVYMRLGDPQQASQQILALVSHGASPDYYLQPQVKDRSFQIYRQLRDAGSPEDALEFMRLYAQSMPVTVPEEVRNEYADSITVFATRTRLGRGFELWKQANYAQVVDFFERVLTQGGLSAEQQVISWQILSVAYYAFGRRSQAEDTFRGIFNLRRNFDLSREIPRLQKLYDLEIYNPETRSYFSSFGPRS